MTNRVLTILDLNDMVEPAAPGLWPFAPVLSVLLILLGLAFLLGLIQLLLNRHRNAYRREGLRQVQQATETDTIMILLKRVALVHWPRKAVAPLHGDEWLTFLNEQCSHCGFEPGMELEVVRRQAIVWIRFHRGASTC